MSDILCLSEHADDLMEWFESEVQDCADDHSSRDQARKAMREYIASLETRLAGRDALIEQLIVAGSWLANLAIDTELRASSVWKRSRDLAENDWDKGIAEYRATVSRTENVGKESVE